MYSMILLGLVALVAVICVVVSLVRGFGKSLVRFLTILLSGVAAVVICLVLKSHLPSPVEFLSENDFSSLGGELGNLFNKLVEYGEISPTLLELAVQLVGALTLPVVCLAIFCLISSLSLVIYLILKAVLKLPLKGLDHIVPLSRLWGAVIGVAQALVIIAVILLPVSGYLSVGGATVNDLVEQGVLKEDQAVVQTVQTVVDELNESPVLTVYRKVGGELLTDSMMKMEVAGAEIQIEEELDSVLAMVLRIGELGENELANYGEKEAETIRAIGESFDDSKLMAPIVGDILYAATDAWMKGETFLGAEKPSMGESAELFDPFMDTLFDILHEDAKTADLLREDVKTVAEIVATLAQHGVLANMNNTETLLTTLSSEGVVESLINTLGENPSMKRLIPEVTNLGVRAIGQVLNLPMDADAVYGEFMEDVAGALNEISTLSGEEQVSALSARLDTAFDEAGVPIDDEILDFYSASMVHDLVENNPNGEVTSADVQAFFLLYSENMVGDDAEMAADFPRLEVLGNTDPEDPFAGTVYANMTEEERKNTATAMLAAICTELAGLDAEDENFGEQAKSIVVDGFARVLGDDHAALEVLKNADVTKPVSGESIQNIAGLKSSDSMKDTTSVVTLADLLLDAKDAAESITSETITLEAEAISAIFNSAGDLLATMTDENGQIDVTNLAGTLGTILDTLNQTGTFGEAKTADLFTAMMQSKTVRETAGLDVKTATEMANQVTVGGGSYAQTMDTVAESVNVVNQLTKNGEISNDDLVGLIRNLTPQTAGMVQIYISADRMVQFGVPAAYSSTSSELVSAMFSYMSREDLEDYNAEANGLNHVLQVAMAAKTSGSKKLFSTAAGAGDGRLPTAAETVANLLGSEAVVFALEDVLTEGGRVTSFDPFGLGQRFTEDQQGYQDCMNAIVRYRASHPEINDLVYEALASLFGVEI